MQRHKLIEILIRGNPPNPRSSASHSPPRSCRAGHLASPPTFSLRSPVSSLTPLPRGLRPPRCTARVFHNSHQHIVRKFQSPDSPRRPRRVEVTIVLRRTTACPPAPLAESRQRRADGQSENVSKPSTPKHFGRASYSSQTRQSYWNAMAEVSQACRPDFRIRRPACVREAELMTTRGRSTRSFLLRVRLRIAKLLEKPCRCA